MANLWRSERLVYRGIDPEDDDFLSELNADSEAFANMSPIIPGNEALIRLCREDSLSQRFDSPAKQADRHQIPRMAHLRPADHGCDHLSASSNSPITQRE